MPTLRINLRHDANQMIGHNAILANKEQCFPADEIMKIEIAVQVLANLVCVEKAPPSITVVKDNGGCTLDDHINMNA